MPFIAHPPIRTRGTHRRQPGPRRSGRRAAGGDAGARRARFGAPEPGRDRWIAGAGLLHGPVRDGARAGRAAGRRLTIPPPPAARQPAGVHEMSRRHGDFALAGVAAVVALDADGHVHRGRESRCSAWPTGRCSRREAERVLVGAGADADGDRAAAGRGRRPTSIPPATSTRRPATGATCAVVLTAAPSHAGVQPRGRRSRDPCHREPMMKIYDLSQPLNQECSFWPYYPPFEVKYIKRKAEHGVNAQYIMTSNHMGTHLDAPRHFVTAGHDHRRDPGRVAVRPRRDRRSVATRWTTSTLYTPKMIEERVEVKQGDLLFLHTGWQSIRSSARRPTRSATSTAIPARIPTWCRGCSRRDPHLGRGLHLDRPPDEPADRPLPRQGHARPLRPRAGKQCEDKFGGAEAVDEAVPRLGLPAHAQRAVPAATACTSRTSAATSTRRSCRTSG